MRFFVLVILSFFCLRASAFDGAGTSQESPAAGGFAHVSKRLLADLLRRDLTLDQPIAETIMNMAMRGTAHVSCQIGLDLVPSPNIACLRLTMSGSALMNDAVASMRSIQVFSSSTTQITGSKDVLFDAAGLRLVPARAQCRTSIQVHDVEARLGLVERIAWRRVDRMQPSAESAASRQASRRAEQQLEAEAGRPLAQLNREYVANVYEPLIRKNALPDMRFSTNSDHLSVRFLSRELPRYNPASLMPSPAQDIAVCLEDSYVNALASHLIGGMTVTDRQFADLMATILGKTPRPLWIHSRAEAWSVVADAQQPIRLLFADDQTSIVFRIQRALRGEQTLARPLDVSAKYALKITPDGPRLARIGDLAIEFADGRASYDELEGQFRDFLKRKFSGVFLSEIYFDGLMPPVGGSWGKLHKLNLTQLTSRDGWLALGYELPGGLVAKSTGQILTK